VKWLRSLEALTVYVVISGALVAGLAAYYGRELEAGRVPDRRWWLRRILIMPILAIAATTATETFRLPTSLAAFCAAMLSLGGYDILNLIELRWKQRIALPGEQAPAARPEQDITQVRDDA